MDISVVLLITVAIAIVTYANKMRKSWDVESTDTDTAQQPYDVVIPEYHSPYTHESVEEVTEVLNYDNLEGMPILDRVENFKFTQYTPPPFIPTKGSFEAVSSEDDLISSFDYDEEDKVSHINTITKFDLKNAVIFSEILKPKWNN